MAQAKVGMMSRRGCRGIGLSLIVHTRISAQVESKSSIATFRLYNILDGLHCEPYKLFP
jgi:hypothetical protein